MQVGQGNGGGFLEEMLEPVSRCLGRETALALTELQVDGRILGRVEALAEKCNEGRLTGDERAEYEAYIQASTLIGILQAKARQKLAESKAA